MKVSSTVVTKTLASERIQIYTYNYSTFFSWFGTFQVGEQNRTHRTNKLIILAIVDRLMILSPSFVSLELFHTRQAFCWWQNVRISLRINMTKFFSGESRTFFFSKSKSSSLKRILVSLKRPWFVLVVLGTHFSLS